MMARTLVVGLLLGLTACVRSPSSTPPEIVVGPPPASGSSMFDPATEPDPEQEASPELDPSMIAPILPTHGKPEPLWALRTNPSTKGSPTMSMRATVLRGVGPERVRRMRVSMSSQGDRGGSLFQRVHLKIEAAPGIRILGGAGMDLLAGNRGAHVKFRMVDVGVRYDVEILFVADEDLVGSHPIAQVSVAYERLDRNRTVVRKEKSKKVSATLGR